MNKSAELSKMKILTSRHGWTRNITAEFKEDVISWN
jgi:hypothetical protein